MNDDNLKPPESTKIARERGFLGGVASGKSKRRKIAMRELISELVNMPISDKKIIEKFTKFFPELDENSINYINLAFMRVIQDITDISTKPLDRIKIIEFIRDTLGEKPIQQIKIDDYKAETMHIRNLISENFSDEELIDMIKKMDKNEQ